MSDARIFQCPECGLHYRDNKTAEACRKFCAENHACSLEITKQSIESTEAVKKS